jgi:Flp pilus assembly protein TadD
MAHFSLGHETTSRLLGAAVICCALSGCAASAARPPEDPAKARAEALKKLSPAKMMEAADQAARRGQYDRAMSMYMQAIEVEPSADLWFRVAWIYATLGKKQLAAQAFAMTIKYDPRNARAHEELGLFYIESKQDEQGAVHLRQAIEIEPGQWRSHNALGLLADAAGDHAAAIDHYATALAFVPDSALLLNNLGYSHYIAGELDEAERMYAQALVAEPGFPPAMANMGLLHARRGDYSRAIEIMSAAMEPSRAYNDVGYLAFKNGDLEAAEALLSEAIILSPSHYETAQQNMRRVRRAQQMKTEAPLSDVDGAQANAGQSAATGTTNR